MKRKIELWDYAGKILEGIGKGALLTVQAEGKVNTMTIGWGTLGIEWGKPICTVFVRESRYTKELLDQNPEFTLNVPVDDSCREILKICGTCSGRDMDKFAQLGLTPEAPELISVPGIRQLPLTLECRVIYRQEQVIARMNEEARSRYYPATENFPEGDVHTAYYGQILNAYIIDEETA